MINSKTDRAENAETIALQALGWLAGHDELLPVFLGSTGASEQDLIAGAENSEFLGAVLDFILMDDAWVIAFCDSVQMKYEQLPQARQLLPGGENVQWT